MKPNPGMIFDALEAAKIASVENCVFIGDTLTDMQAATTAGVPLRILVSTGYGLGLMDQVDATFPPTLVTKTDSDLKSVTPFVYAKNLDQAVSWLLSRDDSLC